MAALEDYIQKSFEIRELGTQLFVQFPLAYDQALNLISGKDPCSENAMQRQLFLDNLSRLEEISKDCADKINAVGEKIAEANQLASQLPRSFDAAAAKGRIEYVSRNLINPIIGPYKTKEDLDKNIASFKEKYDSCNVDPKKSQPDTEQTTPNSPAQGTPSNPKGENQTNDDQGTTNPNDNEEANTPTTIAGKAGTNPAKIVSDKAIVEFPNRRQYNPLSNFSNYTYQLSFYMITPEAANIISKSGIQGITGVTNREVGESLPGFYLLAQSGGVNNTPAPTRIPKAPGFEGVDFFIDDFRFNALLGTQATRAGRVGTIKTEFKITEPYGISFNRRLISTARTLTEKTKIPNAKANVNVLNQLYAIGIRFYGYDKNGNLISASEFTESDLGITDKSAVFERFYLLTITNVDFKLDGKAVTYNIKAVGMPTHVAFSVAKGKIPSKVTLVGSTVTEMLQGISGNDVTTSSGVKSLVDALNKIEIENCKTYPDGRKKTKQTIPNEYAINFEPNVFDNALMVDSKDYEKIKSLQPMYPVQNTSDVNISAEYGNNSINKNQRYFTFPEGSSIISAIEQVIKTSSYVNDALVEKETPDFEGPPEPNPNPKEVAWFSVTPTVEVIGFDPGLNDYAYRITYNIQKYTIPYVRSGYIKRRPKYNGPHKKYEYWYTGKNSEVIRYEQVFNNLYRLAAAGLDPNIDDGMVPYVQTSPAANTTGAINHDADAVNTIAESLYSPSDLAKAKVHILGDPDYLIQTAGMAMDQVFKKTYGKDGFTINPNGGEVFLEINFNAGTDYNSQNGLLDLNDAIRFFVYPKELQDPPKGLTYQVLQVTNSFSKGAFTQELDCIITDLKQFADKKTNKPSDSANRNETSNGRQATRSPNLNNNTAGTPENEKTSDAVSVPQVVDAEAYTLSSGTSVAQPTDKGTVVQDDDASSSGTPTRTTNPNEDDGGRGF